MLIFYISYFFSPISVFDKTVNMIHHALFWKKIDATGDVNNF